MRKVGLTGRFAHRSFRSPDTSPRAIRQQEVGLGLISRSRLPPRLRILDGYVYDFNAIISRQDNYYIYQYVSRVKICGCTVRPIGY